VCGFAGTVDFDGLDNGQTASALARALTRLEPRGPDSANTWADRRCGLANTRLAIQDLSQAANLPMERDGLVIAYNGEIYNFRALRAELEAEGYRFTTDNDSEVLLLGWRAWGEDMLDKLVGMFAFVLWDANKGYLHLARDRFAKKPLYFIQQGKRLTFASDLAALECLLDHQPDIDPAAMRLYFALRWVPEPWSIAKGVHKFPAGCVAVFAAEGLDMRRWYSLAEARDDPWPDVASAQAALVARFDEAVQDRLVADVPIGVFLSGGIDSALVAASMARGGGDVRSFTVGFEGASDYYEERPAARAVADALGTIHTEIPVSASDAIEALDAVFTGLDEPFADSSAVPMYLLAREVRQHVTVALTGDGADEVFGGYRKYQGELAAARYQQLPAALRRGFVEPLVNMLPESKNSPLLEKARRLRRFVAHAGKDAVGRHVGWLQVLSEAELDALLVQPPAPDLPQLRSLVGDRRGDVLDDDPVNAMLHGDIMLGLPSDMLVKVDRMTMAASLEARSPFLDHRVMACAAAMPGSFKLRAGAGKWILRDAFADRLPADVFALPKKGFEIPVAEWLTGPLADLTRRATDPGRLKRQGLFHSDLPARWYDDLVSRRRDTAEKLWTLVAFQAWCERFRPGLAG
jgi:asparagine synthase (glutamine-hydrolysing)